MSLLGRILSGLAIVRTAYREIKPLIGEARLRAELAHLELAALEAQRKAEELRPAVERLEAFNARWRTRGAAKKDGDS